jgi:hypothetical protein
MLSHFTVALLAVAALNVPLRASPQDHIKDLASRYDLVGRVTKTRVLKWNTNPDRKKSGRIWPIDPEKVPGGALYVGLARDRNPEMPYFGDIFVKGRLFGYNEIFVRIHEVKGLEMRGMDDDGNEFIIQVVQRGSGYKRR